MRITEASVERADLQRQRDLLQRKLNAMQRGSLDIEQPEQGEPDASVLQAELDAVSRQLQSLGVDAGVLKAHLEIVAERLEDAEHQLWSEEVQLCLGSMNIRRDPDDPSARAFVLHELRDNRGDRVVVLIVAIDPRSLPQQEDLVTAAQRYL